METKAPLDIAKELSIRLWDEKDVSIMDSYFASDVVARSPLNTVKGLPALKEIMQTWLNAFPDLVVTWDDFITEGDRVVTRWTAKGTHTGTFQGVEPKGSPVAYCGSTFYTLKDGKIVDYWAIVDMKTLMTCISD